MYVYKNTKDIKVKCENESVKIDYNKKQNKVLVNRMDGWRKR